MLVVITGVPGTGKTSIAERVGKKTGFKVLHITDFVNDSGIYEKVGKEKLVDVRRLQLRLESEVRKHKNLIIEGHLACEISLPATYVFVLRTHPKILIKRLRKRGYGKSKVEENLLAELLDYCTQRSLQQYNSPVLEVDSSKRGLMESAGAITAVIEGKRKKIDVVDFQDELRRYLRVE